MRKIRVFIAIIVLLTVSLGLLGCISAPQPPKNNSSTGKTEKTNTNAVKELPESMEFAGGASDPSLLGSMQGAKADAIRKGVIYIIGEKEEAANRAKLDSVLYSSKNQSAYAELIENTRKDKVEDDYIYEGRFTVKLRAIESTLKAQGIIKSTGTVVAGDTGEKEGIEADATALVKEEDVEIAEVEYEPPTDAEKKFIASYVDQLSYLVFFAEGSDEPEEVKNAAIASANEFLIKPPAESKLKKKSVVDAAQVEKLKEEQQMLYEEETGGSMSIIQWIAQKLNADVYIEITGTTTGKAKVGAQYVGGANVSLKAFDASTAELVAQAAYNKDGIVGSISTDNTRVVAIKGIIYQYVMERLVKQIESGMNKVLLAGIKYEVVIQNPPNDRVMSKFWKNLKRDIESYKLLYQSTDEVKYAVWMIGSAEDLKNAFYDASESVTELADMYSVLARGKSITFNSGL